jgi:hypothetical protein
MVGQFGDDPGSEWIGLDLPQDDQQLHVVLDHRTLEATLPNVSRAAMTLVVSPGVGNRKRLEEAADRLPRFGPEQKVEIVGHQALTEQPEG